MLFLVSPIRFKLNLSDLFISSDFIHACGGMKHNTFIVRLIQSSIVIVTVSQKFWRDRTCTGGGRMEEVAKNRL